MLSASLTVDGAQNSARGHPPAARRWRSPAFGAGGPGELSDESRDAIREFPAAREAWFRDRAKH